jgi:hypothetical protein
MRRAVKRRLATLAAVTLLLLLCAATVETPNTPTGMRRFESRHYLVEVQDGDPKEIATLLEQAYEQWTAFFGTEPKPLLQGEGDRLRVRIFATQDEYRSAITADRVIGEMTLDAAGCYAPSNQTVYLWNQFSPDLTRAVVIHEGTHQFHGLAVNGDSSSRWYDEGIAEYFAMHTWDGQKLRLGAVPTIATVDQPAKALHRFEHVWKFRLRKLATDTGNVTQEGYPDAWALVTFLVQEDRKLFDHWAQQFRQGVAPGEAWERTFGKQGFALSERYLAWLRSQQRPWRAPYGAWQQVGDAIEGMVSPLLQAIAVRKDVRRALEATVEFRAPATYAGIILDYHSEREYVFVAFSESGKGEYGRMHDGALVFHAAIQSPAAVDGRIRMWVRAEGGLYRLFVGGEDMGQFKSTSGELGFVVHGGTARFHDVRVDGAADDRPPPAAR